MTWLKAEWRFLAFQGLLLVFFIGALNVSIKELKHEINQVVQSECLINSNATLQRRSKYNDLVQGLVNQQTTAYRLNKAKGDKPKAAADLAFAAEFRGDKVVIPNNKEVRAVCSKPLLK